MTGPKPKLRWYQFTLRALLAVSIFVAFLSSVSVYAHWGVAITIVAGVVLCFHGYRLDSGPPGEGKVHAPMGCFIRLAGFLLIVAGLLLYAVLVGLRMRH